MDSNTTSNSDKLKHAICYIPLGWVVLFFTENKKSTQLMKHIKYGTFLFVAFIFIRFLIVWILTFDLSWLLFLVYAWVIGYLWWKAYNWEDIDLEYIDEFESKIKEKLNDDTIENNDYSELKNNDKKDKNKDDDLLDF